MQDVKIARVGTKRWASNSQRILFGHVCSAGVVKYDLLGNGYLASDVLCGYRVVGVVENDVICSKAWVNVHATNGDLPTVAAS